MFYEPKTPLLVESIESLRKVRDGLWGHSLETKEANSLIAVEKQIGGHVAIDLKARLALPKLVAIEAKMVEQPTQSRIVGR